MGISTAEPAMDQGKRARGAILRRFALHVVDGATNCCVEARSGAVLCTAGLASVHGVVVQRAETGRRYHKRYD